MKRSSKMLPHLNQLYIQHQSYQHHIRKMQQIKHRMPSKVEHPKSFTHEQHQEFLNKFKTKSQHKLSLQLEHWRSPFDRKKHEQIEK